MPNIRTIFDFRNYERIKSALKLMRELQKGKLSGEKKGWLSEEEVENHFKEKNNA